MIFRAIVGSLLAVILALVIATVVLWGKGQRSANQFAQAASDLKEMQLANDQLRTSLSEAQANSETLAVQLKLERESLQKYQAQKQEISNSLLQKKETIRILERENQVVNDWSNTPVPIHIVGLLNQANSTARSRDKDGISSVPPS